MKRIVRTAIVLLLFAAGQSESVSASERCLPQLPGELKRELTSRFPDYRVLQLADLNQDDQGIWEKAYPNACPGIVTGKFSGATEEMAVLLIPSNANTNQIKVVVGGKNRGSNRLKEVFSEERAGNLPVLRRSGAGIYEDRISGVRIRAKHDVILLEHLEATVTAIILDNGSIRTLRLAD